MKYARILVIEDNNKCIAALSLSIVSARWLFGYRGLLVSFVLNGLVFYLVYLFLLRSMLPNFEEIGVLGFGISLGLGLLVFGLRMRVDLVHVARKFLLAPLQEGLPVLQAERHDMLTNEQQ